MAVKAQSTMSNTWSTSRLASPWLPHGEEKSASSCLHHPWPNLSSLPSELVMCLGKDSTTGPSWALTTGANLLKVNGLWRLRIQSACVSSTMCPFHLFCFSCVLLPSLYFLISWVEVALGNQLLCPCTHPPVGIWTPSHLLLFSHSLCMINCC